MINFWKSNNVATESISKSEMLEDILSLIELAEEYSGNDSETLNVFKEKYSYVS
jgi:hypothetical protein